MKKIFSFIFIGMILLFVSTNIVKAESMGVYLEKGDNSEVLRPGDIITVNYVIESATNLEEPLYISKADISIYFDSNVLEVIKEESDKYHYYSALPITFSNYNSSNRSFISIEQEIMDGTIALQPGQKIILAIFKFKVKDDVVPQDILIYNNEKDEIFCKYNEVDEYEDSVCAVGYGNELKYFITDENANFEYMDENVSTPELPIENETIIEGVETDSETIYESPISFSMLLLIIATLVVSTVLITLTIIKLTNTKTKK